MHAQASKIGANSSNQASLQKKHRALRPLREWRFFKPHFDRYNEMKQWGAERRIMGDEEYPHVLEMVRKMSEKSGVMMPVLLVEKNEYANACSYRTMDDERNIWNCLCYTEGCLKNANENEIRTITWHEFGHLKKGHTRPRTIQQQKIWDRYSAAMHLYITAVISFFAASLIPPAPLIGSVLVGFSAGFSYLLARVANESAKSRKNERQAIRFSVGMEGKILDAEMRWIDMAATGHVINSAARPLRRPTVRLLHGGYIYKALNVLLPRRFDFVFKAWRYIDNKVLDLIDAYHYRRYSQNKISQIAMPLAMLAHFIFAMHPSMEKRVRIIEEAVREFAKEHPDWKAAEQKIG